MKLIETAIALCLIAAGLAVSQDQSINIEGVERHYILHVPDAVGENPPLVFMIHGYNMTAEQKVGYTRFNDVADDEKFIVVYPDAIDRAWDLAGETDYNFLMEVIDVLVESHNVDRNRVYAAGFSMGGFMTFNIGCRYSDTFAAVAAVSGKINNTNCGFERGVPRRSLPI